MSLRSTAKRLAPGWFKRLVKNRLRRRVREAAAQSRPVSPQELSAALRGMGVRPGGVLMVHSGMDALRPVTGGPVAIIAALRDAIGPQGTLVMPTFPFDARMRAYVDTAPRFEPGRTPSRVGLLTEIFRRMPEVRRSLHPTHSVAALGPGAEALVAGHHRAGTTFGAGTPFARLGEGGGQVLMLGVSIDRLTLVHAVEDLVGEAFPISVYAGDPVTLEVAGEQGPETVAVRVHDPEVSARQNIVGLIRPLEKKGVVHRGRVEGIELVLIDAAGLIDFLSAEARQGRTVYGSF